jgi:hypothetical protein
MEDQMIDYEQKKGAIRFKRARDRSIRTELDEFDPDLLEGSGQQVRLSDVTQVGSKVVIGGGLGLLAGVAAIAVAASAAEVVLAGVVTKIAGVVGCATGLSLGVRKFKAKRETG